MPKQPQSFPSQTQLPRISSPIPTVVEETLTTDSPACDKPSSKPRNTKTKYALAQPPPGAHRHIRSLVVQVQKLSNSSRPVPIYDAVPALALQLRQKRLSHCLKLGLGMHDIALVTSEEYDESEDEGGSEDGVHGRQIKATISQVQRKGAWAEDGKQKTTVFTLEDGTQWEANPLVSGGYEFVSVDSDGVMRVAKWLPKTTLPRRRSYQPGQRVANESEARRFQFSILDKVTRRRPIMAWMTQRNLDILDRHPGTLGTTESPLQSPSASTDELGSPLSRTSTPEETEFTVLPESLRILIIATAVWVSEREGLTRTPKTSDEFPSSPSTVNFRHSLTGRPSSILVASTQIASPTTEKPVAFDDSVSKKLHRRGTLLAHDATTQKAPRHEDNDGLSLPQRARSLSNGASKLVNFNRFSKGSLVTPPPPATPRPVTPVAEKTSAPATESPERVQRYQPRKSYSAPNSPYRHELSGERGALPQRALEDCDKPERGRRMSRLRLRAMVSSMFKKSSIAA